MAHIGFDNRAFGSFLFIGLFSGLLFGSVFAVQRFSKLGLQAFGTNQATSIQVLNITNTQASIMWSTSQASSGFIAYGETENLGRTKLDDRDVGSGEAKSYYNHIVTFSNLKPKTKYYYAIGITDNLTYRDGYPFVFFTTSQPKGKVNAGLLTGKVATENEEPASDYLVTVTMEKESGEISNTVGTVTKRTGSFSLDSSVFRSADGTSIFSFLPTENYTLDITLRNTAGETSAQSISYSPKNSFPTLIFGSDTADIAPEKRSIKNLLLDTTATGSGSNTNARSRNLLLPSQNPRATTRPGASATATPKATQNPSTRLLL